MSFDQERTRILIGDQGIANLAGRHLVVVGLGGVGGHAAEALARAGVGEMTIADFDRVAPSNCNRQLLALQSTLGRPKVEVMAERLRDINPGLRINLHPEFVSPQGPLAQIVGDKAVDYLVDCIDSIACKAALVADCQRFGVPVASALGAGGRLDVTRVRVGTLAGTDVCPLAREMRKRLRKLGASLDYPVVFSDEQAVKGLPHRPLDSTVEGRPRAVNGTISYMPGLVGLMLAGLVIQALLRRDA